VLGRRYPFVLDLTVVVSWELRRILDSILFPHQDCLYRAHRAFVSLGNSICEPFHRFTFDRILPKKRLSRRTWSCHSGARYWFVVVVIKLFGPINLSLVRYGACGFQSVTFTT
jgi:hypothetical protein